MSKRALKKYLNSLDKVQLEEQVMQLYTKFDDVRIYYNFIFDPKEERLVQEAKFKISKEYFPPHKRRAKARRSVAHKYIKHFLKLGVDAHLVADVMLYNIEIAQTFSGDSKLISNSFTKSMLKSYEQAVTFIIQNGITPEFVPRILKIKEGAKFQKWNNFYQFETLMDRFE